MVLFFLYAIFINLILCIYDHFYIILNKTTIFMLYWKSERLFFLILFAYSSIIGDLAVH